MKEAYLLILQQSGLRDTQLTVYVPPMSTVDEIKLAAATACQNKYVYKAIDTKKKVIYFVR